MADKNVLSQEINGILNSVTTTFEKKLGKKIDPISRSTSYRIRIMIYQPPDIDWGVFRNEIIKPLLDKFKALGWEATTKDENQIGFWIELS